MNSCLTMIYIHILYFIYIYIYLIYILYYIILYYVNINIINEYVNLPRNVIVRLSHPWIGDRLGQETFLAPSADKQTLNYDAKCSNYHSSQSI